MIKVTSSYRNLLIALVLMLIGNPLLELDGVFGQTLEVVMSIAVLTMGMIVRYGRARQSYITFLVSVVLIALWFFSVLYPGQVWLWQVRTLVVVAFLWQITAWLANDVFRSRLVSTNNRLYGAICIYLMAGFCFAKMYLALNLFMPHSFTCNSALCSNGLDDQFSSSLYLYYSFTTLTTVGYGDISPATPIVAMLSNLEAIMGQMYLAIVVARMVGIHLMDTAVHK